VDERQEHIMIKIKNKDESSPQKKRRGRPEKRLKIDDTPENVARALWGERSTKFPKNQGNQTLCGA